MKKKTLRSEENEEKRAGMKGGKSVKVYDEK